jgi:hypothetical protein
MKTRRKIDVARLTKLWCYHTLPRAEVARRVGVSGSHLTRLASLYKLPERPAEHCAWVTDPTPEEIAERARECRERHYAQRRAEGEETTRTKIWKWNVGICEPSAGRHMS